jgi:hypothetical protein
MTIRVPIRRALLAVPLIAGAVCAGYAMPYPDRWNEELVGMHRADAWRLLGVPDIDYTEKGFDGWNRNAIFGAWVLVVRFEESEKISSAEKRFSWGLGYLSWDVDYRKKWNAKP